MKTKRLFISIFASITAISLSLGNCVYAISPKNEENGEQESGLIIYNNDYTIVPIENTATARSLFSDENNYEVTFEVLESYPLSKEDTQRDYDVLDSNAQSILQEVQTSQTRMLIYADLEVLDLRYSSFTQPFPTNQTIPFVISVENSGNMDAINVPLSVTVDGNLLGTNNIGTIKSGLGVNVQVSLSSPYGGSHVLGFKVNADHAIPEKNFANNEMARTLQWSDQSGICAYKFKAQDGKYEFDIDEHKVFDYAIANFGTQTLTNITVAYISNGSIADTFNVAGPLPPMSVITGTMTAGFSGTGARTIGILVDPNQVVLDPNREDNMATERVQVTAFELANSTRTLYATKYSDALIPVITPLVTNVDMEIKLEYTKDAPNGNRYATEVLGYVTYPENPYEPTEICDYYAEVFSIAIGDKVYYTDDLEDAYLITDADGYSAYKKRFGVLEQVLYSDTQVQLGSMFDWGGDGIFPAVEGLSLALNPVYR